VQQLVENALTDPGSGPLSTFAQDSLIFRIAFTTDFGASIFLDKYALACTSAINPSGRIEKDVRDFEGL
jgi:hypothetical protein